MFSLFPTLLDFYPFASLLLRVTAGYLFVLHCFRLYDFARNTQTLVGVKKVLTYALSITLFAVGLCFVAGFYTQVAGIVGALCMFLGLESFVLPDTTPSEREVQLLLFIISLSLVVLGPGPFAIDLPI
jgi:uncharacterized membrane protein YphA (DoxX/SURF4 family)